MFMDTSYKPGRDERFVAFVKDLSRLPGKYDLTIEETVDGYAFYLFHAQLVEKDVQVQELFNELYGQYLKFLDENMDFMTEYVIKIIKENDNSDIKQI